jgi:hypothetical protein
VKPTTRVWLFYGAKQSISFAPTLLALTLIYEYKTQGSFVSELFQQFNRIGGNGYPLGSAVLLLVIAGFLSTFINLGFYFWDFWREITAGESKKRGWLLFAILSLGVNGMVLFLFILLIAASVYNISRVSDNPSWLIDLLQISRWLAVIIFFFFLVGDFALYRSQKARETDITEDKLKKRHANKMSLSRLSLALIDIPGLILACLLLAVIAMLKSNAAFHMYRMTEWPNHVVMERMTDSVFELAVFGVEAGILAATLIVSQLIFAVLVARWQYLDNRIT